MMASLCPHCYAALIFPSHFLGEAVPCPSCGQAIVAPAKEADKETILVLLERLRSQVATEGSSEAATRQHSPEDELLSPLKPNRCRAFPASAQAGLS